MIEYAKNIFILIQAMRWKLFFYLVYKTIGYNKKKKKSGPYKEMMEHCENDKCVLRGDEQTSPQFIIH